jgi:predicted nucleotidyltransferase
MKKQYRNQLKKLGVSTVFLFGSRGFDNASALSDTDIGVLMKVHPAEAENTVFYHRFYDLFSDLFPGSRVDIVTLQTAPLPIQYAAVTEGKVLFEEDPVLTADYIHQVINRYLDFRYVLDEFNRVTLEKYAPA